MCKVLKHIVGIAEKAAPIVLTAIGQPELAAAFVGADSLAHGQGLGKSILSAGGSYLGGQVGNSIGSSFLPSTISDVLPGATNALSDAAISGAGSMLGTAANSALNTSIGGALGGFEGQKLASNIISPKQQSDPAQTPVNPTSLTPAPFSPTNSPQLQVPGSLDNSSFSSLTPDQKTSNLATQGVYGGGLGPQEQQYFTGLVNNQLVDPSGKVADQSNLSPIEDSYLSKLGFGGYSNSNDLLGAISQWQKQQNQATA